MGGKLTMWRYIAMNHKGLRKKSVITSVCIIMLSTLSLCGCVVNLIETGGWAHADSTGKQVIITGNLKSLTTGMTDELWFEWKEKGSAYNTSITATGMKGSYFNATVSNLNRLKTYEYRACVLVNGQKDMGEFVECQPGLPEVKTIQVEEYGWDWAKITGELTHTGGASSCSVGFNYGSHAHLTLHGTGLFTINVTRLDVCRTYSMRAEATNDVGEVYGNSIKVTPAMPAVKTLAVSNVTSGSATFHGELVDTAGNTDGVWVWFKYGNKETELLLESELEFLTEPQSFSMTVSGLDSGRTYYVTAIADGGECRGTGEILHFLT